MRQYLIILSIIIFYSTSYGIIHLKVQGQSFQLQTQLEDLLAKYLPKQIQNAIEHELSKKSDNRIQIQFSDFGNSALMPTCPTLSVDQNGNKHIEYELSSPHPWKQRAQMSRPSKSRDFYVITLHTQLLRALIDGPDHSLKYNCGHRSMYRLALGAIIHEMGHIYDQLSLKTDQEKEIIHACDIQMLSLSDQNVKPIACYKKEELKLSVSSRKEYQMISGFFSPKINNTLNIRLPDPYELTDSEEHFATNLEYYVLDSEFACRRPALYSYFNKIFKVGTNQSQSCESNKIVFYNSSNFKFNLKSPVSLDPSRIYQIHYLLADKGSDMSSRWGHSMLRIINCSPLRKTVGPECMKDFAYHQVVSFRANPSDIILDYVKGFFGGYKSRLFIYNMVEIMHEYNMGELRNLVSVPIYLTQEQKTLFVNRILELFWEYAGKYYFVTNNCATETFNLIKSILNNDAITYEKILSPVGLYELLKRNNIVDTAPLNDEKWAIDNKYLFLSYKSRYEDSEAKLNRLSVKTPQWMEYIESTTSAERRKKYENYLVAENSNLTKDSRFDITAHFQSLESYAHFSVSKKIEKILMASMEDYESGKLKLSKENASLVNDFKLLMLRSLMQIPQVIAQLGTYGVPFVSELNVEKREDSVDMDKLLFELKQKITSSTIVKDVEFRTLILEQSEIEANLNFYQAEASNVSADTAKALEAAKKLINGFK